MISKKILIYSFTIGLPISTITSIPLINTVDSRTLNDGTEKKEYYYSSDYWYSHMLEINDLSLNSFNKAVFDEKKYLEIEQNIKNDLPNLKDFNIDIIKNATFIKNVNGESVFSALFQIKPNKQNSWSDKTIESKNILIPFTNVSIKNSLKTSLLSSIGINSKFNNVIVLDLLNKTYFQNYVKENQSHLLNLSNNTNYKNFKNVDIKIDLENSTVKGSYGIVKLVTTPKMNSFWENGKNNSRIVHLIVPLKLSNNFVALAPLSDNFDNELVFDEFKIEKMNTYFKNKTNVNNFLRTLGNNNNYRNVSLKLNSLPYKENNKYYVDVLANGAKNLKINEKYNELKIKILLSNIANEKWKNDILLENYYTIQAWWNKELNIAKELKGQVFNEDNYNLFKNKFEEQYPNVEIKNFDYDSSHIGKFVFSWDPGYKVYVDAIVAPKEKHLWTDKSFNSKKIRIFIEGWYIN